MTKKFFNPWDFLGFCLFYILALADKLLSINNMTTIRCRRIAAANYSETAENQGVGRQRGRGNGEPRARERRAGGAGARLFADDFDGVVETDLDYG